MYDRVFPGDGNMFSLEVLCDGQEYSLMPDTCEGPYSSWKYQGCQEGFMRTAYRIPISKENVSVWDGGKIGSLPRYMVPCEGPKLEEFEICKGEIAVWGNEERKREPAAKGAIIPESGDFELMPAFTDLEKRIEHRRYDITDLLKAGENAVGIALEEGMRVKSLFRALGPFAACYIRTVTGDGKIFEVKTGGDWESPGGPILKSAVFRKSGLIPRRTFGPRSAPRRLVNNLRSAPADCRQKNERRGWMGDAAYAGEAIMYNWYTRRFCRKWLDDIADIVNEDGSIDWKAGVHTPRLASVKFTTAEKVIKPIFGSEYGPGQYNKFPVQRRYLQASLLASACPEVLHCGMPRWTKVDYFPWRVLIFFPPKYLYQYYNDIQTIKNRGLVSTEWRRENGGITCKYSMPPNTRRKLRGVKRQKRFFRKHTGILS
jgi:hypothetical protein